MPSPNLPCFRAALAEDVPALVALLRRSYGDDGQRFADVEVRTALERLVAEPARGQIQVADAGGSIVGYLVLTFGYSVEYHGIDAFVDELYFIPEYRGRGLGTQALALAERICRERGVRALHLEVERLKTRARELYRRSGFVDHHRVLMTKRL